MTACHAVDRCRPVWLCKRTSGSIMQRLVNRTSKHKPCTEGNTANNKECCGSLRRVGAPRWRLETLQHTAELGPASPVLEQIHPDLLTVRVAGWRTHATTHTRQSILFTSEYNYVIDREDATSKQRWNNVLAVLHILEGVQPAAVNQLDARWLGCHLGTECGLVKWNGKPVFTRMKSGVKLKWLVCNWWPAFASFRRFRSGQSVQKKVM